MSDIYNIIKYKCERLNELNKKKYSELIMIEASSILRFITTDHINNLNKLSKNKIFIETNKTNFNKNELVNFYSSGGFGQGVEVRDIKIFDRALSEEEIKKQYDDSKNIIGKKEKIKISIYLTKTTFLYKGIEIKKQDVISFVANKLGGVHFDKNRNNKNKGKKYQTLDLIMNEIQLGNRNPIYVSIKDIINDICETEFFKNL